MSDRFESLADKRIREAIERGEFENLPGQGKPIEGLDRPYDPNWWVQTWLQRERLTEARREQASKLAGELATVWPLANERAVLKRVSQLNARASEIGVDLFEPEEIVRLWREFAIFRRNVQRPSNVAVAKGEHAHGYQD